MGRYTYRARKEAGVCVSCAGERDGTSLHCSRCNDYHTAYKRWVREGRPGRAPVAADFLLLPRPPRGRKRERPATPARLCSACGLAPAVPRKRRCAPCEREHLLRKSAIVRRQQQSQLQYWRSRVLAAYGGQCVCCGIDEPLFLEIDHIDGDGKAHRRTIGVKGGSVPFYRWVIAHGFPANLQVLCRNCNFGRYRNGGLCPHQTREGLRTLPFE